MARFVTTLATIPAILGFLSQPSSTAATPLTALEPRAVWGPGFPACFVGNACPGLWPSTNPNTPPTLNTTRFNSINDAALLAEAAVKAISAPHFDYFFERNATVEALVKTVFTNIAGCAEGRICHFSLVFAETDPTRTNGWCKDPGRYSYAPAGATSTASQGGGVSFMCPKGLALPRNPTPCTTDGNPTISLGYALVRALVQEIAITDPNNSGTLFDGLDITSIIEMDGNTGDWDIKELGWGTEGDGLMGNGVGNAADWATYATLSWDLGYGPAPWTGTNCQSIWSNFAALEGLVPIS